MVLVPLCRSDQTRSINTPMSYDNNILLYLYDFADFAKSSFMESSMEEEIPTYTRKFKNYVLIHFQSV